MKLKLSGSGQNHIHRYIVSQCRPEWATEPFSILGITYTSNLKDIEQLNFDKKLEGIKREITRWSKRHISPVGTIKFVKCILLSKRTHLFSVLPKPSAQWVKNWEQLLLSNSH